MFKMQIKTDNAAFEDDELSSELARILRDVADLIEQGRTQSNCRDVNGNLVGGWSVTQ